ncbi:hypothetical protein [Klebsiella grimontii]|uniref:hypothetical protein n=1 Tax=Klebsiella grimontii TaxID=2058152 RepID=UPI002ADE7E93|nr:hypothetical protein [Klebsiella grimontii]
MTIATPASAGVSLAMLLAAKKRRAAPQAGWLADLLSTPGDFPQAGHACSHSRNHPVELVLARVEKMNDDWFARD